MISNRIRNDYFNWMYDMVCVNQSKTYYELFHFLDQVEFVAVMPMDVNRAEDGRNFRYRFGYETGVPSYQISDSFGPSPCSLLEMMVALAHRCEEQIMRDSKYGDRTNVWFWEMIKTLGLDDMYDGNFDPLTASHIVYTFLKRKKEFMKIFREVKGIPEPDETEESSSTEREGRIVMKDGE